MYFLYELNTQKLPFQSALYKNKQHYAGKCHVGMTIDGKTEQLHFQQWDSGGGVTGFGSHCNL